MVVKLTIKQRITIIIAALTVCLCVTIEAQKQQSERHSENHRQISYLVSVRNSGGSGVFILGGH